MGWGGGEGEEGGEGRGGQAGRDCQGSSRRPTWASALAGGPGELKLMGSLAS